MSTTDPSRIDFRLPSDAHKRQFRKITLLQLPGWVVGVVAAFLFVEVTLFTVSSVALAILAIWAIAYYASRQTVYISLSRFGVSGTGETARNISIPWNEPMTVTPCDKFYMKGVEIRASQKSGLFRSRVSTFYVPEEILAGEEFQSALLRYAPATHPMRAIEFRR